MSYRTPITDADLHAYVDGQLTEARRQQVEAHLARHPEAAEQVAAYQNLNDALTSRYGELPAASEILPIPAPAPRSRRWRAAAAAGWVSIGMLAGWLAHDLNPAGRAGADPLVVDLERPAAFAHSVYSVEVKHPVEVSGTEQAHLTGWLSKRMKADIRAPRLTDEGFQLIGGRLLPSTNRMAGQFMYERSDGQRVTLYVRRGDWQRDDTAFRFARQNGTSLFYWIDGSLGYALAGELDREQLLKLAHAVHGQLHGQNAVKPPL